MSDFLPASLIKSEFHCQSQVPKRGQWQHLENTMNINFYLSFQQICVKLETTSSFSWLSIDLLLIYWLINRCWLSSDSLYSDSEKWTMRMKRYNAENLFELLPWNKRVYRSCMWSEPTRTPAEQETSDGYLWRAQRGSSVSEGDAILINVKRGSTGEDTDLPLSANLRYNQI